MSALSLNMSPNILQLRIVLAILSLFLSVAVILSDDIINKDGILYMQMAEAYMQGGMVAMAELYNWPFFALSVALISKVTGLHPETSSGLLNAVLFVVFTDALLMIARQLVPNIRQLIIAALLILLFYSINEYRDFIIRDIGYWAFISLALLQFLYFLKDGRWQYALLWQIFGLIALLFRIEASIILLAMPLFLLFSHRQQPLVKPLLRLYSLLIIASLFVLTVIIADAGWTDAFGKLGNIAAYLDFADFQKRFAANSQLIAEKILHPVADDEAGRVLFFGLVGMLAMQVLIGLSAAYILILMIGWKMQQPLLTNLNSKAIAYFLLINIGILLVFSLNQYFVTTRYCLMAFVALFLLVLPRLTAVIDSAFVESNRGLQVLIVLLLIYSLGDIIYRSNSKSYIPQTAKWATERLPINSKVLTNSEFIDYYVDKYAGDNLSIKFGPALKTYQQFDYLLIVEKRRGKKLREQLASMSLEVLFSYENNRGEKASVYQVLKPIEPSS